MAATTLCGGNLDLGIVRNRAKGKRPFVLLLSRNGRLVDRVNLSMEDTKRIWRFLERQLPNEPRFWHASTDPRDEDEIDDSDHQELGGEG